MAHLIDKAAVVSEIKRLIDCCYKICAGNLDFLQKSYPEHYYSIETYKEILSFINTLEVKDVELEKEIGLIKGDYEQVDVAWNNDFDFIARHFFELGLSVNSPITAADRGKAEETIKEVCEWLDDELCCYIKAQDFTIDHARLNKDLRKHLENET